MFEFLGILLAAIVFAVAIVGICWLLIAKTNILDYLEIEPDSTENSKRG